MRVRTVDKEVLELMKQAGCHLIKVGVESGVQNILDKSKKGILLYLSGRRRKTLIHMRMLCQVCMEKQEKP